MNKKSRFFAAVAYILCVACIFTGLGCSARASLSVAQDKSAVLTFKTATGKTLDGTIRSITGAEQNALLFDEQAIRSAFSQTGLSLKELTFPSTTGISLTAESADLNRVGKSKLFNLQNSQTGGKLSVHLTPQTLNELLKALPEQTADYADLLLAPVFTGEKMSADEYVQLIGSMYGSNLQKELQNERFVFDIEVPGRVTKASLTPAASGNIRKTGSSVSADLSLYKFLANADETQLYIEWEN